MGKVQAGGWLAPSSLLQLRWPLASPTCGSLLPGVADIVRRSGRVRHAIKPWRLKACRIEPATLNLKSARQIRPATCSLRSSRTRSTQPKNDSCALLRRHAATSATTVSRSGAPIAVTRMRPRSSRSRNPSSIRLSIRASSISPARSTSRTPADRCLLSA